MLELYKSGFAFDDDNNYIPLDNDDGEEQMELIISTSKLGLDIQLEPSIPSIPSILPTIKYLRLDCSATHYKNLILPNTLEYIHLHLLLQDIFKNNVLDYITLPTTLKSLSIILDDDMPSDTQLGKNIKKLKK